MQTKTNRIAAGFLAMIMVLSMLPFSVMTAFAAEVYHIGTEEFSLGYTAYEEGTIEKVGAYSQSVYSGDVYLISLPRGAKLNSATAVRDAENYETAYTFNGDKYNNISGQKASRGKDIYLPADGEYITGDLFRTYPQLFYSRVYKNTAWNDGFELPVADVNGTIIQLWYTLEGQSKKINTYIIQIADEAEPTFWQGSGTAEDPFILKTPEDLKLLSDTTNKDGKTHLGEYFRFGCGITLPADWEPVGTSASRFSGTIDGAGYTLTVPAGSLSLIGTPSGAVVKNLNLYGEKIPGYGLVHNYTTNCAMDIENVTILSGSHILYSGFIGGYGNTSVNIRNCTVQKGVTIGDDGSGFWGDLGNTDYNYAFVGTFNHRDNIGSFAGAFNGTIIGCVSYATVYGRSNVGGIVGMKGQSMREMRIADCAFYGDIIATGSAVGGIVGGGYKAASAPATPLVSIENCHATGNIRGGNYVGGIFGGEMGAAGGMNNGIGRVRNNYFSGNVSAIDEGEIAGGIMGYIRKLSTYTDICDNYYVNSCGAVEGIGKVESGDTTDDTTQNEAEKISTADLTNGNLLKRLSEGKYGRNDYLQGEDYPVFGSELHVVSITSTDLETYTPRKIHTDYSSLCDYSMTVKYSDGSSKKVKVSQGEFSGIDFSDYSTQRAAILYENYTFTFGLTIVEPPKKYMDVSVAIYGDTNHGADSGETHTLKDGNITEWVSEKTYSVVEGSTVRALLEKSFAAEGIDFVNDSGNYISEITYNGTTLGELTNGAGSGWMYTVNGEIPNLGIDEYILKAGDSVLLFYTDDYKKEHWITDNDTAAEDVAALIDAIGEVTLSSGNAITLARTAYDALTDELKAIVTNYSLLAEAEKAYSELIRENEELEKIYNSIGDSLTAMGTLNVGSIGGEWVVIGLARSGREVPEAYYENVVKYVREHINDKEQLHRAKSTDNARVILALTALGYDVTDVAGHNLLGGLADMSYLRKQGINGPIWALIAFDCHGYEIPAGDVSREALIDVILGAQLPDGGWALSGDESDPDMTAMAIQSLAPYYDTDAKVKSAVDSALERLSVLQTPIGGYHSWGMLNAESCAQVIVALTALGIDPETDSRFIKNGCSVLDALRTFYTEGGFSHTTDGEQDSMATEQGYCALAAYFRFAGGKTSLYNMSDVTVRGGENPKLPADVGAPDESGDNSGVTDPDRASSNSPQTGDSLSIVYIGIMIIAFSVALTFTRLRRRESDGVKL